MKRLRSKRPLAPIIVATLATAGVLATPSAATAAGTVGTPEWLSIQDSVTYESCNDVPYSLAALSAWGGEESHRWGNVFGYNNYKLDLRVIGPDGTEADTDYVSRIGDDLSSPIGSDAGSLLICDGAGRYVVQARGSWCPLSFTITSRPADCKTIQFDRAFTMRAAKTKVSVAAKKTASLRGKHVSKVRVMIERSTGYYPASGARVKFQWYDGRRWQSDGSAVTNGKGVIKYTNTFSTPRKFKFRATVVPTDDAAKSTGTWSVKVRR